MALPYEQIANFINNKGMADSLAKFSGKKFVVHFDELRVENVLEHTPANFKEGMVKELYSVSYPLNLQDAEIMGLLVAVATKNWAELKNVKFIAQVDDEGNTTYKSFAELNGETLTD